MHMSQSRLFSWNADRTAARSASSAPSLPMAPVSVPASPAPADDLDQVRLYAETFLQGTGGGGAGVSAPASAADRLAAYGKSRDLGDAGPVRKLDGLTVQDYAG